MTAVPTAPDPPAREQSDEMAGSMPVIVVCRSCRIDRTQDEVPRPGALLAEATRRAAQGSGVGVKEVGCLGNCKRGASAAILHQGAWSYIFGELAPENGPDLVAGALLLAKTEDGFMPFRARPEALRRGLVARIPTFAHLPDLS